MKINITWDTPQGRARAYVLGSGTDFNTRNVEIPDDLAILMLNIKTLSAHVDAAVEALYTNGQIPAASKEALECLYLTHVSADQREDLAVAERRLKNRDSVARTRGKLLPSSESTESSSSTK